MWDFSIGQINTELPSTSTMLYTLVLCLLLVGILSFTYEKTTDQLKINGQFIQSMILGALATSMIVQAIGDSVGRGLGLLGTMAIIRFRTNLTQPRNIIFLFAAFGIGISTGVYGFNLAILGTLIFCLAALVLRFSPYHAESEKQYNLRILLGRDTNNTQSNLEATIRPYCKRLLMNRLELLEEKEDHVCEINYIVSLKNKYDEKELLDKLSAMSPLNKIRFNLRTDETQL